MYSVVIPTMWKYSPFVDRLPALLEHHLVSEIIIIDNNKSERPQSEILCHEKIILLEQDTNIFVNPAWNLGVKKAGSDYICILNDDVIFDTHVFSKVMPFIMRPDFGLAGMHPGGEIFTQVPFNNGQIDIVEFEPPENSHGSLFGFGTLFFVKKSQWIDIPDKLLIYYGDDWNQAIASTYDRKIWLIANAFYNTPSAQTCVSILSKDERDYILAQEQKVFMEEWASLRDKIYSDYIWNEYELACKVKTDINEHVPTLRELALECDSVVELGVREGWSTRAFLTVKNKLRSYDIIMWPYVSHLFQTMKNIGRDFDYIQASSLEIELDDCDMIFFDTEHTYEQLSRELELHGNKARKYLVFHDTVSYRTALVPAITEFLEVNPHWDIKATYYNNNGLMVLERR